MSDNSAASSGGVGLSGLLGVLFIALKLTHVITWPWVWVLAPFWVPLAVLLVLCLFVLVVALCCALGGGDVSIKKRKRPGS